MTRCHPEELQAIARSISALFEDMDLDEVPAGYPSALLSARAGIRAASAQLEAQETFRVRLASTNGGGR